MDTLTIRQKLHDYIDVADDEQVEALYADINGEANERYEWWNDEEMVMELERRSADLKSGKDPGMTLEEATEHLLSRLSNLK